MPFLGYCRYAFRMVRRAPLQFLVILLTLAVGIGANSAMFSIVDSVLLRPLPYPDPDRVVTITLRDNEGVGNVPISYPDYEDWTRQAHNFASITATRAVNFNLLLGDVPERVRGTRVTSNIMTTLGVEPELGRGFRSEEAIAGNEFVAMISHEFWKSHFSGSRDVIGKTILLGRVPYVLVGVLPPLAMPQALQGANVPEILVPYVPSEPERNRGLLFLRIFGRVKPGVDVSAALAEMQVINAAKNSG
jgi:putative ABC transport system permease protein